MNVPESLWKAYEAHICFARALGKSYPTFKGYIANLY